MEPGDKHIFDDEGKNIFNNIQIYDLHAGHIKDVTKNKFGKQQGYILAQNEQQSYLFNTEENEMLPSIRNLAKDLRISILTVKKAYDELEQEAYIKTVQGKGTFVASKNTELVKEQANKEIEKHIFKIVCHP